MQLPRQPGANRSRSLRGFVFLHWLNVELLFVDEAARNRNVGRRLLESAEQKARTLGARNVTLNIFEWQAREFYLKQGYEEFGRIENYACLGQSL